MFDICCHKVNLKMLFCLSGAQLSGGVGGGGGWCVLESPVERGITRLPSRMEANTSHTHILQTHTK